MFGLADTFLTSRPLLVLGCVPSSSHKPGRWPWQVNVASEGMAEIMEGLYPLHPHFSVCWMNKQISTE